jgi:NAD(P)-dependent dehydrogenase (short-subunit alcohol dehydrogenase family)
MVKTAIVTGASGNMGQAVVKKFMEEGYKVIGTVIPNDKVKLDFPEDKFEKRVVDLVNEEEAASFVSEVIKKYGTIDVAVLTVGGFAMGKIADTRTSDILRQYQLNFETTYNTARPIFLQMLTQNKGRIFLVGARPGLDAKNSKGMVAYGLSKSLIFRLAELMNEEAKGHNIVVSVLVPSTIDTPQNRQAMPDAKFENWVSPEAFANVVYFYASEEGEPLREPVIKVYNNA